MILFYIECVFMKRFQSRRPFFSRSFQSGFFRGKDSLRVSKIQKNSYILNPPKMASIRSISSVWLERAPNISRRQINSVLLSAQGHRFEVCYMCFVV